MDDQAQVLPMPAACSSGLRENYPVLLRGDNEGSRICAQTQPHPDVTRDGVSLLLFSRLRTSRHVEQISGENPQPAARPRSFLVRRNLELDGPCALRFMPRM